MFSSYFLIGLQIHPLGHGESGVEADLGIDDYTDSSFGVRNTDTITPIYLNWFSTPPYNKISENGLLWTDKLYCIPNNSIYRFQ